MIIHMAEKKKKLKKAIAKKQFKYSCRVCPHVLHPETFL